MYRDEASALREQLEATTVERDRFARELEELRTDRAKRFRDDIHITVVRVALWAQGLFAAALAPLMVVSLTFSASEDPQFQKFGDPWVVGLVMGGSMALLLLVFAGLAIAGAIGLGRATRWGWAIAAVVLALSCVSCLPLGVYGLFALMRPAVRDLLWPSPLGSAAAWRGPAPHPRAG